MTIEERRELALHLAVTLIGSHKGFRTPEDAALSAARAFETYLKGENA